MYTEKGQRAIAGIFDIINSLTVMQVLFNNASCKGMVMQKVQIMFS